MDEHRIVTIFFKHDNSCWYVCANGENKLVLIFLDSIDGKRNFGVFLALIPQTITE